MIISIKLDGVANFRATWFSTASLSVFLVLIASVLLTSGCTVNNSVLYEISCIDGNCAHPLDVIDSTLMSKVMFVEQIDQMGCGAAVLSAVLAYWDKSISYNSIISEYHSKSGSGYSVGELKAITLDNGLIAISLQMTEEILKNNLINGRPIIVPIKKFIFKYANFLPDFIPFKDKLMFDHFVVVFGFDEHGYWVMDPSEGYLYLPSSTFREMWGLQRFVGLLISSK